MLFTTHLIVPGCEWAGTISPPPLCLHKHVRVDLCLYPSRSPQTSLLNWLLIANFILFNSIFTFLCLWSCMMWCPIVYWRNISPLLGSVQRILIFSQFCFLEEVKCANVGFVLCVYPFSTFNQLTDIHETWNERFAIGCYQNTLTS
jgi:magnesium-transporting ATPase (P-type)